MRNGMQVHANGSNSEAPNEHRAASYFDVDGTLTRTNLFDGLWFYLMNQSNPFKGLGRVAKTVASIPAYFAVDQVDRSTFNEMLFRGYEGMTEDRLLDLSDEVFETVLRPALYKDGISLVKRAKLSGHRIVLLSGSPDFLLQRLGKMLEADDIIGAFRRRLNGISESIQKRNERIQRPYRYLDPLNISRSTDI